MKRKRLTWKFLALPALLLLSATIAPAQGQVGTVTVNGTVRIDGQIVSGSVPLNAMVARISTAEGASIVLNLASGGEVRLSGQADMLVAMTAGAPRVQLICGEVVVTSSVQTSIISSGGGRATSTAGRITVTRSGEAKSLKEGKSENFDAGAVVTVNGLDTTGTVQSGIACDCNC